MSVRTALFTAFLSSAYLITGAQSPSFSFRNININEGLSQSSVVDIAIDKTGFLWFATQDGLNRYDGKEFLVFHKLFDDVTTPLGNQLGKVITGNDNDLWLITSGGKLERLDLNKHAFSFWDKLTADSIPLPAVSCLLPDPAGRLLIGTASNGLYVYSIVQKKLERYSTNSALRLNDDHIQSIFTDKQEQYWILTGNGVTLLDKNLSQARQILGNAESAIPCSAMEQDDAGNYWLGTFGKGLFLKRPADSTFHPFTGFGHDQMLPADLIIETIRADRHGRLWIGTYGKGLYMLNTGDQTVQYFLEDKRKPFSLDNNDVLCMQNDTRGGLWIGTDGGGISYYNSALNNFSTYTNVNLPAGISIQQVRSVLTDEGGNIWAGTTNQGLVYIDPVHNEYRQLQYTEKKDSKERIVSLLSDKKENIWLGTQGNGLMVVDIKTKKRIAWFHPDAAGAPTLPDHTVWCMLPYDGDTIIAGTQNAGICFIDKRKGIISIPAIPASTVQALEKNVRTLTKLNDSVICVGYERKGIQLFNFRSGQLTTITNNIFQQIWNGETVLKCVYFHPPFLLMGTLGKGLLIYDLVSGKTYHVSEADGLPNNTVYGILPDKQGYLWLSSNRGLFRLSMPENPATINQSNFSSFNVEDGLQSNEFNTGAYFASADGRLFFGGVKGLNFFNPAQFINTAQNIPVVITKATINNEPFQGDTVITYKKHLRLNYDQNAISFTFAALDYLSNARLNYSYRLEGYDATWIDAGNRNYVAYTNLQPGKYIFQVRTFNPSGNRFGPVTSLSIGIVPPYWKSWWFMLAMIVAIVALLYAFYRYRVNQLLKLQRVRSRIATDLHDDIGSTLTNINILSELSKKNLEHKEEAEIFLNRITEEVNVTSQALDDIVWSINKDNDTLAQTIVRMRRYAAEVFEGANIAYSLQSDEGMADRKLNMDLRRDFYLLFKESINNIYKHSKARNVDIRVWMEKNHLHLRIKDDGQGFSREIPTHRNGIKNMEARVAKWRGRLDISSTPGVGTRTEISLPGS
jgi:ligand-binding sensor domain-containing protein/signal transduction histidine kinase